MKLLLDYSLRTLGVLLPCQCRARSTVSHWQTGLFLVCTEVIHLTHWFDNRMVYTEPSEKLSLETVWKRASIFKTYLAGDWMSHLSITTYHRVSLLSHLNQALAASSSRTLMRVQPQVHNLKTDKMDSCMLLWIQLPHKVTSLVSRWLVVCHSGRGGAVEGVAMPIQSTAILVPRMSEPCTILLWSIRFDCLTAPK